jgi:hypothetical protein
LDYHGLIKRLELPPGWAAPPELHHEDIRASALTRDHLRDDVLGINASLELIRRTRGGSWPTEPVTEAFNYVDLVWHECEFREGYSFAYAVYNTADQYLGCAYLYPVGRRTPLTAQLLGFDVDVSWWVTPDAYRGGYYTMLYRALRDWVVIDFPFANPYYSNVEIPAADDS